MADEFDPSEFGDSRPSERGRRAPRRWVWFVAGLVVGVAGALLLPSRTAPYLPGWLAGETVQVSGPVRAKQREPTRLLLTLQSERGTMLATFHERIGELDLLIAEGDTVSLRVPGYRPFVEDPELVGVNKPAAEGEATETERTEDGATEGRTQPPPEGRAEPAGDGERGRRDTTPATPDGPAGGADSGGATVDTGGARPDTLPR